MVILCAEDDEKIRLLLLKLLQGDGFTVMIAGDGQSALEASRNHPGHIDLLLSDVGMPRMNGLELCKFIAAERPDTKVLMMSGDLGWREQVSMFGLPFLQKPFTATAVRKSIEALLGPCEGR